MKKMIVRILLCFLCLSLSACTSPSGNVTTTPTSETVNDTINVYTRDASSGTREAFEKTISLDAVGLTSAASEVSGNGDMATKVGADQNGIGYVSLTTDFAANKIKSLKYESVEANVENVLNGSYRMQRPFAYLTRSTGDYSSAELEELTAAFIAFITESEEGMAVIEDAGGIVSYDSARPWAEVAQDYPVLNQDNSAYTLRTGGSTSVEKCISAALKAFKPLAGNVNYAMNQTGSGDAYKRTLGDEKDGANAVEIGFASRDFKAEEPLDQSMLSGTFCKDAVVVVVSENNALEDLNQENLQKIFSGQITKFSEIQ